MKFLAVLCLPVLFSNFAHGYLSHCTSWERSSVGEKAPLDPGQVSPTIPYPRMSYILSDPYNEEPKNGVYKFHTKGFYQKNKKSEPVFFDSPVSFNWLDSGTTDERVITSGSSFYEISKPLPPSLRWEHRAKYGYEPLLQMDCFLPY